MTETHQHSAEDNRGLVPEEMLVAELVECKELGHMDTVLEEPETVAVPLCSQDVQGQ